ncbi:ribosomal protein S4 [Anncaliia algerae PRA109]|uniref:Ribosomal protein S4 n=1 Tax=Anncaliia algerae PRA339 TaxID=1288291 RepID=A0A059F428_9MICR|nr:ribosomal protein S4 [Anncaliia algerae PRA109]KCZ81749.1 ribosomal protein S4 [Anncaliia algerae PRA339]
MAKTKGTKKYKVPLKPYDKDRLIDEMKLLGEFGLKNKRELWVIQKTCDDTKRRAKDLLISTSEDEIIVSGRTLLARLVKLGIISDVDYRDLDDIRANLEKVLDLTVVDFLERRLQHRVFVSGLAISVHQARNMINHKHISVNGYVVDRPGYMVSVEEEGHVDIHRFSSLKGEKLGRSKKRKLKAQK